MLNSKIQSEVYYHRLMKIQNLSQQIEKQTQVDSIKQ